MLGDLFDAMMRGDLYTRLGLSWCALCLGLALVEGWRAARDLP